MSKQIHLAGVFELLFEQFKGTEEFTRICWIELKDHYSSPKRHYHNFTHLSSMFSGFERHKKYINDPEILSFSIFYHDFIYNPLKKNNEELSAEKVKVILERLKTGKHRIEKCASQIMATKTHIALADADQDIKWLIDFDLEILGSDWDGYITYSEQIRKEYAAFPWPLYREGRMAALKSFLERENIYQTGYYKDHFEAKARDNIQREIREMLDSPFSA